MAGHVIAVGAVVLTVTWIVWMLLAEQRDKVSDGRWLRQVQEEHARAACHPTPRLESRATPQRRPFGCDR